jgi:hypothetical protein
MALVLLLNLVRYLLGGPIESVTIMRPMHSVMPRYPEVFDNDFMTRDFIVSLFYVLQLHALVRGGAGLPSPASSPARPPVAAKPGELRSDGLFFCSLAALYMNHFTATVKPFSCGAWSTP